MGETNYIKITQSTAASICAGLELGVEAGLIDQELSPADYLKHLLGYELYADALSFLASALPKREATWWACQCSRHTLEENPNPADVNAILLAEAWVYKPNDDTRLPAFAAAEQTGFSTSAGWAAAAAFYSGGNISPSEHSVVQAPAGLFVKAVTGSIMLAAVNGDAANIQNNYRVFISKGMDIAKGGTGRA